MKRYFEMSDAMLINEIKRVKEMQDQYWPQTHK